MKKKIVIASDSFKGSASTIEVESFIECGIKRVNQNVEVIKVPIADGGEGTLDALVLHKNGQYVEVEAVGPIGKKVTARFGVLDGKIAVIEMAEASGLTLISDDERNPYKATTYGTGELLKAALDYGVEEIYIGIGGSATNDGGAGMAQALGISFKDKEGNEIEFGAESLLNIDSIDISNRDPRLKDVKITVLSDVTNPLCGQNGASYIYGPQKGASSEDVKVLDKCLFHYGQKIKEELGIDIVNCAGGGAAGGLGAGLIVFCDAVINQGITKILDLLDFEGHMKDADLVITGEGRIDSQSLNGKAPIGVAKLAKKYDLPVIAVVGSSGDDLQLIYESGIDLVIDIINKPMELQEAIQNAEMLITQAGEEAYRAFCLKERNKGKKAIEC